MCLSPGLAIFFKLPEPLARRRRKIRWRPTPRSYYKAIRRIGNQTAVQTPENKGTRVAIGLNILGAYSVQGGFLEANLKQGTCYCIFKIQNRKRGNTGRHTQSPSRDFVRFVHIYSLLQYFQSCATSLVFRLLSEVCLSSSEDKFQHLSDVS